jgi:hypothetical protein
MPEPKFKDFKPVKRHEDYLIRDLGDNNTGNGHWVELSRADGWGFGSMPIERVEDVIEADKVPPTGGSLSAIFGVEEK